MHQNASPGDGFPRRAAMYRKYRRLAAKSDRLEGLVPETSDFPHCACPGGRGRVISCSPDLQESVRDERRGTSGER